MTVRPLLATLGALMTGCVLSIDRSITATNESDADLAGNWYYVDEGVMAEVRQAAGNKYDITSRDSTGQVMHYRGHLGVLGAMPVLELGPGEVDGPDNELLIRGHVLMTYRILGDTLVLRMLDEDSLKARLRSGTVVTPYLEVDEGYLYLTGDGDELRRFWTAYLSLPAVWSDASRWQRVHP